MTIKDQKINQAQEFKETIINLFVFFFGVGVLLFLCALAFVIFGAALAIMRSGAL